MSDPVLRPISGNGELPVNPRVWPSGRIGSTPGPDADTKPLPDAHAPEPDRAEMASTGEESYAVFSVQPKTGVMSIKIVDAKTDRVIRQMPSEEILHIAEQVQAYLAARRNHGKWV